MRELLFRQPTSVSAGIIASVASKLARSRHGALIVIVNETGLQDVIETGDRTTRDLGGEAGTTETAGGAQNQNLEIRFIINKDSQIMNKEQS